MQRIPRTAVRPRRPDATVLIGMHAGMTVEEAFRGSHAWLMSHGLDLLLASVTFVVACTLTAYFARRFGTGAAGRFFANAVLTVTILEVAAVAAYAVLARSTFDSGLLSFDASFVAAPIVSLALALGGLRLFLPVGRLAVVRLVRDLLAFAGVCAVLFWIGSKFRGWGVVFVGSIFELLAIVALALLLVVRLWRSIGEPGSGDGAAEGEGA